MPDIRAKALHYLRDGCVTVGVASVPRTPTAVRPDFVSARVQGHHGVYRVHLLDDRWSCSCGYVWSDGESCAHLAAVQLVTGWPSAAAKPERVAS